MASVIRGNDNFDSSAIGVPDTVNAVGTYVLAGSNVSTGHTIGNTRSGSQLHVAGFRYSGTNTSGGSYSSYYFATQNGGLSGTWRRMGGYHPSYASISLWVRIS